MKEGILVLDVGKTHKKALVFDRDLKLVQQDEVRFAEVRDEDGFPCEDMDQLESWVQAALRLHLDSTDVQLRGVNITTYGASLIYLDAEGKRIAPLYNYLKPLPKEVLDEFFMQEEDPDEFFRKTASPRLGMLNSGFQILWLQKYRPAVFSKVAHILHLPQYLSFLLHGQLRSEHSSIGCHTALWDFDHMCYHSWLQRRGIALPEPADAGQILPVGPDFTRLRAGIGVHDSSASLVPYLKGSPSPFILVSTGTWCITMNPFNQDPLSQEELEQDCLCYLSVAQKPVKASRLFLGHMHDTNAARMEESFQRDPGSYKQEKPRAGELDGLFREAYGTPVFFAGTMPGDHLDLRVDPLSFQSFHKAYARLMCDLVRLSEASIRLVLARKDESESLYISGGFSRNPYFTGLLARAFPDKKVFTSEVDNATSLGAAMLVHESIFQKDARQLDLGLQRVMI